MFDNNITFYKYKIDTQAELYVKATAQCHYTAQSFLLNFYNDLFYSRTINCASFQFNVLYSPRHLVRKPALSLCDIKGADQLQCYQTAEEQRLVLAT